MTINRYNYEEYFLLYTDNELQPAERIAVEDFILQNPDLGEELQAIQQAVLIPDNLIVFQNKESLFHDEAPPLIHPGNFTEYAINYADNELGDSEMSELRIFLQHNPQYQEEIDLYKTLKFRADESIVFPDKKNLYRYEKVKFISSSWWRVAAAAIVLAGAGLFFLNKSRTSLPPAEITKTDTRSPKGASKGALANTVQQKENNKTTGLASVNADYNKTGPVEAVNYKRSTSRLNDKSLADNKRLLKPRVVEHFKKATTEGVQDNAIAANSNNIELPRAVKVSKPQEKPDENIATIDASINKRNETIRQGPSIHFKSHHDENGFVATNVAHAENTEEDGELNEATEKKGPLRGLLRKASRFIDKNTALRSSKKSGLQIGNIEIAFQ